MSANPNAGKSGRIVHKFGGSSVADADCFHRVAAIIESDPHPVRGVVLSACRGVTDALLALVSAAEANDDSYRAGVDALIERHTTIARAVLGSAEADGYVAKLKADCQDILGVLHAVRLVRSAAQTIRDVVSGYGEIWSTRLFAAMLTGRGKVRGAVQWLDAREVLVVEWGTLGPVVQWPASSARLATRVPADFEGVLVITGFIAADARGVPTTLGRNGSDYSGSIFGALLDAEEIIIWTDVNGVLSADPRRVPDAKIIDSLSYHEAMELAYFGAKVIHPQTMAPAVRRQIPIWIKNTFAPAESGTVITTASSSQLAVKGITTIDDVALLNLEGAGMIGVPGAAQRLFGALRDAGISVILISQASSEHSICFAVPEREASRAEQVVRRAFEAELREGQIQSVAVAGGSAILAVVGDGMAGTPGVAGKLFAALADAAVNVRAIAQGASERNISVVVDARQSSRALRAVHSAFYLSPHTLSIGVIGPGIVGRSLLAQIHSQLARLEGELNVDLRVRGIMGSRRMVLDDRALPLDSWEAAQDAHGVAADIDAFVAHVNADHLPHAVIVDCTASADVAARYEEWLRAGIHIVTPNKRANSGPYARYAALQRAGREVGSHYLYEATVGAGLPVIRTLADLRETGDEVKSVDGIFSGTLAYLFNVYDGSEPFSAIVRAAKAKGYTEPDPRDDLSGTDVARKLIILGREIGLKLELSDVDVESLVPADLAGGTAEEFLEQLPAHDAAIAARVEAAARDGKVLRYVGRIESSGRASVGLTAFDRRHAFANIALTDNVVRYTTSRYSENPLIVQGPGAGPEVTAGGVFADLLRLCAYLGART